MVLAVDQTDLSFDRGCDFNQPIAGIVDEKGIPLEEEGNAVIVLQFLGG
jgi:hypothetical protein